LVCTMAIKLVVVVVVVVAVIVVVTTRCDTLAYELEGDSNND